MLAYVICCKKISDYLKILVDLSEKEIKYEPDPDRFLIYITEPEAVRDGLLSIKEYLKPRRCYLRTVKMEVDPETLRVTYGEPGSGITTGTNGLYRRIQGTTSIGVYEGAVWYPKRRMIWCRGVSWCKVDDIKSNPEKMRPEQKKFMAVLESMLTTV